MVSYVIVMCCEDRYELRPRIEWRERDRERERGGRGREGERERDAGLLSAWDEY